MLRGSLRLDEKIKYSVLFIKFDIMKTTEINTTIVDGYVGLLDNLSTNNKLDLISKLTASVKTDLTNKKSSFKKSFGAFDSKKSAEEIIEEIRNSRVSTRQIESF
jgi:hypothetical protein